MADMLYRGGKLTTQVVEKKLNSEEAGLSGVISVLTTAYWYSSKPNAPYPNFVGHNIGIAIA